MKLEAITAAPLRKPPAGGTRPGGLGPDVRLIGLLLALITVLVYLPAGFYSFIDFDDVDYVSENPVVQNGLTWAGFKWAFIGWHASNWHPLTWLSHELDCQLFGLNAGAHHLVNVLFHAANTVLLFQLWWRLTRACWPSALVAALFAWHPLHVESVAWVAERKDVLSTFFGLLTLLMYTDYAQGAEVRSQKSGVRSQKPEAGELATDSSFFTLHSSFAYGLALACFALGLMAKPMLVTLPCVLLLLDYWPLQRLGEGRRLLAEAWRLAWEKWPFFLLAAGSCVVTWLAQRDMAVRSLDEYQFHSRLENIVVAYAGYLGKTLWPVHLCIFYPLTGKFAPGEVVLSAIALAAVSLCVWRWRGHRYLVTGWLWFLGMLVPVIGLVQVGGASMADRYMYLPAVGLFAAAAFGLAEAQARWKIPARTVGVVSTLLLAGCVAATEYQLHFWRNSEVLFKRTLAVTKNNAEAHMMLGVAYEKQGRNQEARQEYHESLNLMTNVLVRVEGGEMRPLAAQVQLMLGRAVEQKGQTDDAMAYYRETLRLDPDIVEAHNNLGNLLDETGKADEALAEYRAAVRLQPKTPLVHENLGTQLLKMGRFEEAMQEYQEAVRLAPEDPQPLYLIAKALLRRGQGAEAVITFKKALQLSPDDCPSLVWLARVLAADESASIRNGAQAVTLAEQANKLTGGHQPSVLGALAMAYAETGRFEDAVKTAQAALGLSAKGSSETTSNLQAQLVLYQAGRPFRDTFTHPSGR